MAWRQPHRGGATFTDFGAASVRGTVALNVTTRRHNPWIHPDGVGRGLWTRNVRGGPFPPSGWFAVPWGFGYERMLLGSGSAARS